MSRAPPNFRESDLRRVMHVLKAEGKEIAEVEIEGSRVRIRIKNGDGAGDIDDNAMNDTAEWDEKYGKH